MWREGEPTSTKTPYRGEPDHEHGQPAKDGPCVACPWCQTPFAPEEFHQYESCEALDKEIRESKKKIRDEVEMLKKQNESTNLHTGRLGPNGELANAGIAKTKKKQKKHSIQDARANLHRLHVRSSCKCSMQADTPELTFNVASI